MIATLHKPAGYIFKVRQISLSEGW